MGAGRGDVTGKVGFGNESWWKGGGKYRGTEKVFDWNNSIFSGGGNAATRFTLGQFGLQGADVISRVGGGHDYLITPVIDAGLIDTFTADPANAAYFVLDETSTLANATARKSVV